MMSQKALVTGAGGFLGQYIAEQLVTHGDHVRRARAAKSYGALTTVLGVESILGDIRDADTVRAAVSRHGCCVPHGRGRGYLGALGVFLLYQRRGHAEHPGSVPRPREWENWSSPAAPA